MGAFRKRFSMAVTICVFALLTIGLGSAWAQGGNVPGAVMSDPELDQIRGGYAGVYFGFYISGFYDHILGNVNLQGDFFMDGGMAPASPPEQFTNGNPVAEFEGHGAVIQAYIGEMNGASGFFQCIQAGSYNVIQNNMMVQLTIVNVADSSALPALRTILGHSW